MHGVMPEMHFENGIAGRAGGTRVLSTDVPPHWNG